MQPSKRAGLTLSARHPHAVILFMTFAIFTAAGVYWHFKGTGITIPATGLHLTGAQGEPASSPALDQRVNNKFVLGGLKLGMTLPMAKAVYPAIHLSTDRTGGRVAIADTRRGLMVAWFAPAAGRGTLDAFARGEKQDRIYRLRLDEAFPAMTEADILRRYGREYGRPLQTNCARTGLGDTPRCTYRWWGGDGIELQAISKRKTDADGRTYTQLTTIATDTSMRGSAQTASLVARRGAF